MSSASGPSISRHGQGADQSIALKAGPPPKHRRDVHAGGDGRMDDLDGHLNFVGEGTTWQDLPKQLKIVGGRGAVRSCGICCGIHVDSTVVPIRT